MASAQFPANVVIAACLARQAWAIETDSARYEETIQNIMAHRRKIWFFWTAKPYTREDAVKILAHDMWSAWGYFGGGPGKFGRRFWNCDDILTLAQKCPPEQDVTLSEMEMGYLAPHM